MVPVADEELTIVLFFLRVKRFFACPRVSRLHLECFWKTLSDECSVFRALDL